jgi:hypothetical protein
VKTSDKIDLIATALSKTQAAMTPAKKTSKNPHFKSSYANLASAWEAAQEPVTENGLSVSQTFEPRDDKGVQIETTLMHVSGQWMQSTLVLYPTDSKPQSYGSAITYGRRYSLMAILGLVADEDDGNKASGKKQVLAVEEDRPENAPPIIFDKDNPAHRQRFKEGLVKVFPDVPSTAYWSLADACHGLIADDEILFAKVESILKNKGPSTRL